MQVKEICYQYETGRMALDRVSAEFFAGEKVAVIGANGSGKSTFFLNLNGVYTPDSGEMAYRGKPIGRKERSLLRRHVGFVFQDADQQMIAPTVRAEISFGPMNLKLERPEVVCRTEAAMERMGLAAFADRAPHHLSGGEKKRVSIADVLAMEPEIILFDEPTTALDATGQQMLERILGEFAANGKTVVVSTHDVDFAWRFADRVLVFEEGRILAQGRPEEIFAEEAILAQAHLRRPVLWETAGMLKARGLLRAEDGWPRTLEALHAALNPGCK